MGPAFSLSDPGGQISSDWGGEDGDSLRLCSWFCPGYRQPIAPDHAPPVTGHVKRRAGTPLRPRNTMRVAVLKGAEVKLGARFTRLLKQNEIGPPTL